MNLDATTTISIVFIWVLIATPMAYFLAKGRVENVILTTCLNFLLAFIPPFSLISLLILAYKEKKETATT